MFSFPYKTPAHASIAFSVKVQPSDFEVEEILSYEPCGEGEHAYLEVEKSGISTRQAIQRLARVLSLPEHAFGYAGLKDARGLTRQTISAHVRKATVPDTLEIPDLRILRAGRHTNKIRIGHLRENRFAIKLRDVHRDDIPFLENFFYELCEQGIPNYFGIQRFGIRGDNWKVGQAVIRKNWETAKKIAGPFHLRDPRMVSFYVNAFQSWLFNLYLAKRIENLGQVLDGDLAYRHDNGAVFLVENPQQEQERADRFEISPSGPLFGYKMTRALGRPGEWEQELLDSFQVSIKDFLAKEARRSPGARRALRVQPSDPDFQLGNDENGSYCRLQFSLPSGSYATALLWEMGKEKMNYVEKNGGAP